MTKHMDNTLTPIEDLIRTGLAERFFKVFGVPLLFYNGPDVKKVAAEMLKKKGKPEYPYAVAKTSTWAVSEQTYRPHTLLRRGLKSKSSHDYVLAYELNMIPVTTTYEMTFYVQGFPELQNLAKRWLLSSTYSDLKYTVTHAVRDVDIHVSLEKNLQTPTREGGTTEVKEYQMTSTITVMGYMSEQLKTSQAAIQLEMLVRMMDSPNAEVTFFTEDWPSVSRPTLIQEWLPGTSASFVFPRAEAGKSWYIDHGLGRFPTVTVVDPQGRVVPGTVHYPTDNAVILSFTRLQAGTAYLV